jgi:hypothetical protein
MFFLPYGTDGITIEVCDARVKILSSCTRQIISEEREKTDANAIIWHSTSLPLTTTITVRESNFFK